jgi:hypothetical protein|uniref:Uncharacterized protein n=1 Tax=Meiothermus ruber TaxID=277 RepID=A0A7C3DGX5_MEIRU
MFTDPQPLFIFQFAMSLLVFGLIARQYLEPWLARLPLAHVLSPLLFFHAFRYVGASFMSPSVIDPSVPSSFTIPGTIGDLLAAFLALVSLGALRGGSRWALPLLWVFNLVGTLDFINAIYQGVRVGLPHYQLGATWFIITLYVPALLVVHLLIFRLLLTRSSELSASGRGLKAREAL